MYRLEGDVWLLPWCHLYKFLLWLRGSSFPLPARVRQCLRLTSLKWCELWEPPARVLMGGYWSAICSQLPWPLLWQWLPVWAHYGILLLPEADAWLEAGPYPILHSWLWCITLDMSVLFSYTFSPFLVSPWVTGIWTWDASSLMPQSLSLAFSLYLMRPLCLTDPPVSTRPPWGHFHIHCFYTFKHCRVGLLRQLIRKDVTFSYLRLRSHSLRAWLSHSMIHSSSFVLCYNMPAYCWNGNNHMLKKSENE